MRPNAAVNADAPSACLLPSRGPHVFAPLRVSLAPVTLVH